MSALSQECSLYISLISHLHSTSDSPTSPLHFRALLDSGSTHCFADTQFVHREKLITTSIPPIPLKLFDGTSNQYITECTEFPVQFLTRESMILPCYVTLLDLSYSVVLGHNWLFHYNLLVDWKLSSLTFCSTLHFESFLSTSPLGHAVELSPESILDSIPPTLQKFSTSALLVSLINAATFMHASKLPRAQVFMLNLAPNSISMSAAKTSTSPPVDLSNVPEEYHEFTDVFSKSRANT